MDFFAHQEAARRASSRLGWVMAITTTGIVVAVNPAVAIATGVGDGLFAEAREVGWWAVWGTVPGKLHLFTTLGTLAVIVGGSLYKHLQLAGGGRVVAESLGGRELHHATADAEGRRLLNIVEEMALASGVPRPPVYLLPEPGINAFAAGLKPDDAAIGVTEGAVRQLSRDELQGVIAHEFSHILNGDMRLNLRLMAVVHGLLAIALVGRVVLEGMFRSRPRVSRGKKDGGGVLVILGIAVALIVIGSIGWLCGRLIQAAFSRQREFLADASAVQFTRNPGGIAGALSRIAGASGRVTHANAPEAAHLFFADGLVRWFGGAFATHPPLDERIRRIGGVPVPAADRASSPVAAGAAMGFASGSGLRPTVVPTAGLSPERVAYGAQLLERLPEALREAAAEAVSARAAALLPILAPEGAAADRQLALVRTRDAWLADEARRLLPVWRGIDPDRARLPLLHLAVPALQRLSAGQRRDFFACLDAAAAEDGLINLREFLTLRFLRLHLAPSAPSGNVPLRRLRDETATLLGTLARLANPDPLVQHQAFAAGWGRLPLAGVPPTLPSREACAPHPLGRALDRLSQGDSATKRALIDAAAHAVAADGTINAREAELLRIVADQMGVPLPPFADS
jgi:Zn-dependent protease with chaperone function